MHVKSIGEEILEVNSKTPLKIDGDGYFEVFTSKEEMDGSAEYAEIVDKAYFKEFIIRTDGGGFIKNPLSNRYFITIHEILQNFEDFRKKYNQEKYILAHRYAFKIGGN